MSDKEEKKPIDEIVVEEDGNYDSPEASDVEESSQKEEAEKSSRAEKDKPSRVEKDKPSHAEKDNRAPLSGFGAFIRKFSIRTWLLLIVVLILSILAMLFFFHKNFRIQRIYVSGNQRFSTEDIIDRSGIQTGDHLYANVSGSLSEILRLQYGRVRNRIINSDPYIADAKVYPHYPGEVYIEVTERRKVAYVAIPDGYAIISDDSVVLEIENGEVPTGIPEIRGLPIRGAQIGKRLDLTSSDGYDICITILGAILGADANATDTGTDFDFLSHVVCVRYCENMTTFIDLDIPGNDHIISVKIGSLQTISDDMTWLRYAIISGHFDGKPGTVLDMTGKEYILR